MMHKALPATDDDLLDAELIEDLVALQDARAGRVEYIIERFQAQWLQSIDRLVAAQADADLARMSELAHALAGASASIGLRKLAAAARALQTSPSLAEACTALEIMSLRYGPSIAALRARLGLPDSR